MLFQQNNINPCIYKRFCDNLDLEQHGDDFLVCGLTSNLEVSADELQESSRNVADLTEKLDPQADREFRSGAGICQYMTEQRFDIAIIAKEIMREAAGPTTASKTKLKRIARYLKGRQ